MSQQEIWDQEHKQSVVLPQMNRREPSGGVKLFWDWLQSNANLRDPRGLEMGCGKGRNSIWLSNQGAEMTAFDFSDAAIEEAKTRAREEKADVQFIVQDATVPWPFQMNHFDFGVDCFASTDIDSFSGRAFSISEFFRVLKPGGFLFLYLLSTDDELHKMMIARHPAEEKNSFRHPQTGKFEKAFDEQELNEAYAAFKIVEQRRIEKDEVFFGKSYHCKHHWRVYQKPR